jgi:hypothetical protein
MGPATPMYASPEQLANKKNTINHRSDFFNLGILTYELIVGQHPFDPSHVGSGGSYVENIVNGNRLPMPQTLDTRLNQFVENTLSVEPYRRFRTVSQVKNVIGIRS